MPPAIAIGGPAQQDNHVTMNISMNGTGSDGVRSLMNILKDIEHGAEEPHMGHEHDPEEPLMGDMIRAMGHEEGMGEEYENSVHGHDGATEFGIDAVTFTGDDLASKGKGALKHNGGENPMHESLVNRLSQMYNAIKEERTEEKNEKGEVVRWKEETPWRKATGKDGRGKVTNMSDKARRESEKLAKDEKISEWGVNLMQPRSDLFGKAPAEYNDESNTKSMLAKYDAMIADTQKEIDQLKANPTGSGSDSLMKSLQDQLKGLQSEKSHNLTGTWVDDASNALRKQAIAKNELTPGQWLQKATQYFKGKITGQPQPGVSYDRYDTSKQAQQGRSTPTPYKPDSINESADILRLAKMLRG
jgi:hypothetical protein